MNDIRKKSGRSFGAALLCLLSAFIASAAPIFTSCAHTATPESGVSSPSSESFSDPPSGDSSSEDGTDDADEGGLINGGLFESH